MWLACGAGRRLSRDDIAHHERMTSGRSMAYPRGRARFGTQALLGSWGSPVAGASFLPHAFNHMNNHEVNWMSCR
jgi:hypothetical protein